MHPVILQSIHLTEVTSTNDLAKQLAESNAAQSGTWIQADSQSQGRGQEGNTWESGKGQNVLGSLLWMPHQLEADKQVLLNMAVSLAVYQTVCAFTQLGVRIKWPNDVYVGDSKIAGILIENSIQGMFVKQCVIGIGMNVNQTAFENTKATSLRLLTGSMQLIDEVVQQLHFQLNVYLPKVAMNQATEITTQYHRCLYRLHTKGWFASNGSTFEAMVSHVDAHGRLALEVEGQIQLFGQKEITWI
ncbi:MAG: biotin--[acetyl-CoA-carboxylase] ligase [Bacteroidia bacterium]|nr:biotin--[acetyl-CoA-carboxylase] ligase [Bacteroidia bacterium]